MSVKKSLIFVFVMFCVVIGLTNNVNANPYDIDDQIYDEIWDSAFNSGYAYGLEQDYNDGYDFGYNQGYVDGLDEGANYGYQLGYVDGLDEGYIKGINENMETGGFGLLLASAFTAVGALLSIQLLPNISIGAIVAIPIVFGVVMFIIGRRKE